MAIPLRQRRPMPSFTAGSVVKTRNQTAEFAQISDSESNRYALESEYSD